MINVAKSIAGKASLAFTAFLLISVAYAEPKAPEAVSSVKVAFIQYLATVGQQASQAYSSALTVAK